MSDQGFDPLADGSHLFGLADAAGESHDGNLHAAVCRLRHLEGTIFQDFPETCNHPGRLDPLAGIGFQKVHRPPDNGRKRRQAQPAPARGRSRTNNVARAIPQNGHGQTLQAGDDEFAVLPILRRTSVANDLDNRRFGSQVPGTGGTRIGQGPNLLHAIVLERRHAELVFNKSPLPIEGHFAREIDAAQRG